MLKHEQQEETELLQKQQEEEEHNRSIKTVMILALADMKMACEQETKSLEEELEKLRLSLQHVLVLLQQSAALIARKDLHVAKSRRLADEMPKLQEYLEKEDIEKKLLSQTNEELLLVWPVARLECLRCEKEELENSLLEQLKELRLQKQKELQVLQEMLKHEQQEETELLQKQQEEEEHNRSIKTVMILALADMKMACEQEKKSLEEELEKLRLSLQPIEEDKSLKVALEMKNQEIKDQHDHLHVLVLLQQNAALIARKDLHVAKSRYVSVAPSADMTSVKKWAPSPLRVLHLSARLFSHPRASSQWGRPLTTPPPQHFSQTCNAVHFPCQMYGFGVPLYNVRYHTNTNGLLCVNYSVLVPGLSQPFCGAAEVLPCPNNNNMEEEAHHTAAEQVLKARVMPR
ncbi:hypothetical protein P4O66_019105, partial [Electrophorus voltai]